ncbi:redoxin domain-containing protein [Alicyclobacillus sp. SO9]|uniref:redoxin domain-containing protein n=1 Tax=Alicyclobacillus sp. SO9 TaxID=2665646 RepID=UPI0018E72492|nr:redoxin domain-containing protein [Alicyclobacillus sp. SO9]QQE79835.1 SCO family protein [Alicyclobacillus sp. SO9]
MKKNVWSNSWLIPIAVLVVGITALSIAKAKMQPVARRSPSLSPPSQAAGAANSTKASGNANANSSKNVLTTGDTMHNRPAPNFTLTDQFGKKISLKEFRGKTVVLAFVDSTCTTICPLTTQDMLEAKQLLGPTAAKHVQLLGINANPQDTSVADVKKYSVEHSMVNDWHFLTAPKKQLEKVWKDYYVYSGVVNGKIDHTPALYIIGPKGNEKLLYLTPSQYSSINAESHIIAKDIAKYLPQSVKKPNITQVKYQTPNEGPKQKVTLPAMTPTGLSKTVVLSPKKPHLVVFFASFVPNIKEKLTELNKYASLPGSPQVVAVDVATLEPSLKPVKKLVSEIPNLHIKVAVDKTGRVADSYGSQDLTWFSLTNASGQIVWHHDEWLKMSKLQQDVSKVLHKTS